MDQITSDLLSVPQAPLPPAPGSTQYTWYWHPVVQPFDEKPGCMWPSSYPGCFTVVKGEISVSAQVGLSKANGYRHLRYSKKFFYLGKRFPDCKKKNTTWDGSMISKKHPRHTKTAKAILDLYKSLPEDIQDEVRELITLAKRPVGSSGKTKKNQEQEFYQWLEKNRIGLPEGYTFDREEANAR